MKRTGEVSRKTKETQIKAWINLDGGGEAEVNTGIGFFDHMLNTLARHSTIDIKIEAKGDLKVDEHHTIEDVGLCFGQAIEQALGNKKGINRFGWAVCPMDESLARVAIDISGRPYFSFKSPINLGSIGTLQAESIPEFFKAISVGSKSNFHFDLLRAKNTHHAIEALFKAFAKALNQAVTVNKNKNEIPSTKGTL